VVQTGVAKGRILDPDDAIPLPYLRVANVQDGFLDLEEIKTIDIRRREKERYMLQQGDVLLTEGGDFDKLGRGFVWNGEIPECVHQNHVFAVRLDRAELDPAFFSYQAQSSYGKAYFLSVAHKTTNLACINSSKLKAFPVLIPPLPEQKKIAHILSTVQRAIEMQERIIQTTTELKKALMHKLFIEGIRHEPQKQTDIGPIPESWEVIPLGEFFQVKHGFAFDGEFFKPSGDYILMTPGHFHEEGGFRDQKEKTKFFTGDIPQDYVLAKDDLVVAMTEQKSGLLGSAAFVPEGNRYLHNQRLGLIVDLDTQRLSKRYLFHVFNLPHVRVEVTKTSTGSKVKHTSPTKLRAVKVGIPPTVAEQEEIASALSTTQQKINVAASKKAQLLDLFRTLLHELMTAKTRVNGLTFPSSTQDS
jgi:type I restriction enzyme S subunit